MPKRILIIDRAGFVDVISELARMMVEAYSAHFDPITHMSAKKMIQCTALRTWQNLATYFALLPVERWVHFSIHWGSGDMLYKQSLIAG
jgi:hypothetical protein